MLYVIMEMELVMDGHGMLVELYVNGNEEPRCKCYFETSLRRCFYYHIQTDYLDIIVNMAINIFCYCYFL